VQTYLCRNPDHILRGVSEIPASETTGFQSPEGVHTFLRRAPATFTRIRGGTRLSAFEELGFVRLARMRSLSKLFDTLISLGRYSHRNQVSRSEKDMMATTRIEF
jgi:hypothetical protein